jgi:hypothetical protein
MKKIFFAYFGCNRLSSSIRFLALLLVLILQPLSAYAFSLPWSCGFEGGSLSSCGLSSASGNNTDYTSTAAAHTGTYGYRIQESAGHNISTGGFYGSLDNAGSGFYVRWYMREGATLQIRDYQKLIQIFDTSMTINNIYNVASNSFWLEPWGGGNYYVNGGFATANGSTTGDGKWHCYELHATVSGMQEWWIDGVYQGQSTGANLSLSSFNNVVIQFNTNQDLTSGGNVDWDDIAIQTTGPIGPIGGGNSTRVPDPPSNVH